MSYDYGFKTIGNQLVDECKKANPDFELIENLLKQIDDINILDKDEDENILSKIILGYPEIFVDEQCDDCKQNECLGCEYEPKESDGKNLPKIIELFLEYGFDVNAKNGLFGGMCLKNLSWASYDEYILDAAKLLLKAGANPDFAMEETTVIDWMATKESAASCVDYDYDQENLFYTMVEILSSASKGKKYDGINYYKNCIGSTVSFIKVLINKDNFRKYSDDKTIMGSDIVFVCGEKNLVITTEINIIVDEYVFENHDGNISQYDDLFGLQIVGSMIESIYFEHNEIVKGSIHYGQPNIYICLDNGIKIRFTYNYGEVAKNNVKSYFTVETDGRSRK